MDILTSGYPIRDSGCWKHLKMNGDYDRLWAQGTLHLIV